MPAASLASHPTRPDAGTSPPGGSTPRGRWIPWMFFVFFGVVLAVNGTMLGVALQSWNGLETENAYKQGLAYNDNLAAAKRQAALGWRTDLDFRQTGGQSGEILLHLQDKAGQPIDGATVQARLVRPTHQGFDRNIVLEPRGGGRYQSAIQLPLAGQWDLRLAILADGQPYQIVRRIQVEPGFAQ